MTIDLIILKIKFVVINYEFKLKFKMERVIMILLKKKSNHMDVYLTKNHYFENYFRRSSLWILFYFYFKSIIFA